MRRLELTLSGRHIRHSDHLLTYKLLYRDRGYGMFLLELERVIGTQHPSTSNH